MKFVQELFNRSDQVILLVYVLWGIGLIFEKGVDIMWIDLVYGFLMKRFFFSIFIYFYY